MSKEVKEKVKVSEKVNSVTVNNTAQPAAKQV